MRRPLVLLASIVLLSVAGAVHAAEPGPAVVTHHETIPNLTFGVTFRVVAGGGVWSNPSTWTAGRVPGPSDDVIIDHDVTVDTTSATAREVGVYSGTLSFATAQDTELTVGSIYVYEDGRLEIGTEAGPIADDVTATITIRDIPMPVSDPDQFSRSVLGLNGSEVFMHGRRIDPTFIRATGSLPAGATTIQLESSASDAGWRAGDAVVIPRSSQCDKQRGEDCSVGTEERTITAVSGTTITLDSPLTYTHPCSRYADGRQAFCPHVAHMERNVIIRSQNPDGMRFHTFAHGDATWDTRYVLFKDGGRTTIDDLANNYGFLPWTKNQKGRYPVHMHHNYGPITPLANGYQYNLIGNVVDMGTNPHDFKWALTLHNSHFGLVQRNTLYRYAGAGLSLENGTETQNVIDSNFLTVATGGNGARTDDPDPSDLSKKGAAGGGIWWDGSWDNTFTNNVVAHGTDDCVYCFAFKGDGVYSGTVTQPAFQGADPQVNGVQVDTNALGFRRFEGNEAYAVNGAMTLWWHCAFFLTPRPGCTSEVKDLTLWHNHSWGFYLYETSGLTIDGYTALADPSVTANSPFDQAIAWTTGDYAQLNNLTLRNWVVHGYRHASGSILNLGSDDGQWGTVTVEDSEFSNLGSELGLCNVGSTNGSNLRKMDLQATNVRFPQHPQRLSSWRSYWFEQGSCGGSTSQDPNKPIKITVTSYDGQASNDFTAHPRWQPVPSGCNDASSQFPEVNGYVCQTSVPPAVTPSPTPSPSPSPSPTQPPASSQVIGCEFSEGGGTTTNCGAHAGALSSPTWTTRASGGALQFDGTDDHVDVGEFDVAGDQLTLAAWVNPDVLGGNDPRIIAKTGSTDAADHAWALLLNGSAPGQAAFRVVASGVYQAIDSGTTRLEAGSWTHVAATYDGSQMKLFFDGQEVASTNHNGSLRVDPTMAVWIGGNPPIAHDRPFDGALDDVRVFSRALTTAEILGIMSGVSSPAPTPTPTPTPTATPQNQSPVIAVTPDNTVTAHIGRPVTLTFTTTDNDSNVVTVVAQNLANFVGALFE